ncbi:MAG: [FeFe] hydrogenase H-cluster radical SAM maturase HydG [Deltaproteobacteria bacterium]|nr:[FeFe] hydrogenase H-cluster radical SAM maturase HydG [Deltaproteobacteria bacterium]
MVIDSHQIEKLLKEEKQPSAEKISTILEKAAQGKGLGLREAATLLSVSEPLLLQRIFKTAGEVKEKVFGKRVVLFAPLYLSNYCTNGCLYCGFRNTNKGMDRTALEPSQVVAEAKTLEGMGFKRVLLVTGEDPRWGLDYIIDCVKAVYKNTGMRIIHLNAPPTDTDSLRKLKEAGVGVYQSFQETYHRPTYELMHPTGRKKDYDFRLEVMDRAMEAGFGDVGIGPLLGLYDFRFDALASIAHSFHLYEKFGAHAHTISIPRLRPAEDFALKEVPYTVTDEDLKKIVAVFRLSVPTAGIVASTRETAEFRSELLHVGATQLSAASRTNPGGYTRGEKETLEQFSTTDHRSLIEVMGSVIDEGYLPSLCTTCYRVGRVGHEFTEKTLSGSMEKLCQANAILTIKEYLSDYAQNGSREMLEKAINMALNDVSDPAMKKALLDKIKELEEGKRDLYF